MILKVDIGSLFRVRCFLSRIGSPSQDRYWGNECLFVKGISKFKVRLNVFTVPFRNFDCKKFYDFNTKLSQHKLCGSKDNDKSNKNVTFQLFWHISKLRRNGVL